MSISVQELDNTVRALFEGKGALVSDMICFKLCAFLASRSGSPPPYEAPGTPKLTTGNRI